MGFLHSNNCLDVNRKEMGQNVHGTQLGAKIFDQRKMDLVGETEQDDVLAV